MEWLKGWKTVIFNVIITGLAALQAADLVDIVPEAYIPFVLAAVGAINVYLRTLTTTPAPIVRLLGTK